MGLDERSNLSLQGCCEYLPRSVTESHPQVLIITRFVIGGPSGSYSSAAGQVLIWDQCHIGRSIHTLTG